MIKKLAYIFIFLAYSLALFSETDFSIDDSIITKILNGKVYTLDNLAKNSITIIFDDNKISGKSTINTYSASYRITGDNIEITDISASKMNGPQNLMKEEEEYLQLLSEAHNLEIKGNILKIKTNTDKELIFKEVIELSSNYLKGKEFVLKNAFDELNITIGFTKNKIYGIIIEINISRLIPLMMIKF
ncbi:META domain-containing protein [Brachyspira innocens]|uniref:META domain-containing protein n=1 Tax=Brachyspira innocens TaxID=13264 RepID=UPI0026EDFA3C|nr:META domain-containing protein [Brachyspira innocens]MDO6994033.1 META domain-containing protein [Brachyspira innocens]